MYKTIEYSPTQKLYYYVNIYKVVLKNDHNTISELFFFGKLRSKKDVSEYYKWLP